MSNEIFDRETQLDLLVNIIPLFILGFFIVGFVVFAPFGVDPLASSIQFGLVAIPFVLLAVLTYFAAVAVAGSEKNGPVYLPGQAGVSGAEPLEVPDADDEDMDSGDSAAELGDTDSEAPAAELNGDAASGEPDHDASGDGPAGPEDDLVDADEADDDSEAHA
ncbi:hypothetical protein GCM10008995_13030 [Halobellus salinus]|uniref:Cox cluster protein n=1 Tax=Halobellus salinus TaxID=931585 RepID=A0A830EPI6_9EURY|nr:DUF6684 family protein [Halobellus salinus]GGJ04576.1 hypothetical protein GCM10008995_13030 [Halobellus salinus]SMP09105.1 hypothetical protein SAMN06265347_10379 [Halobellus salinus]